MRHKDMELMRRIREFAERFYAENGRSPSTAEIGRSAGVTKDTVHRYLKEMDEKDMISYNGRSISTEKTERVNLSTTAANFFHGAIPCGPPTTIEASVDEVVRLPTSIFGSGSLYIIRAQGESMIGAGIDDGDLVVVEAKPEASVGDIVVALDGEQQNTLKTLMRDDEDGRYYLHPENPEMGDIYVNELSVQGVAQFVIKKLRG